MYAFINIHTHHHNHRGTGTCTLLHIHIISQIYILNEPKKMKTDSCILFRSVQTLHLPINPNQISLSNIMALKLL